MSYEERMAEIRKMIAATKPTTVREARPTIAEISFIRLKAPELSGQCTDDDHRKYWNVWASEITKAFYAIGAKHLFMSYKDGNLCLERMQKIEWQPSSPETQNCKIIFHYE